MAVTAVATEKAGFLTRLLALIVDSVLLAILNGILTALLFEGDMNRGQGLNLLLGLVYFVYFWSGEGGGRTLGMRALNIRVVKTDGSALTVMGAVIRYLGFILSAIPFLIGLIWAAFDAQKQGWHDKIAGTYVVKTG